MTPRSIRRAAERKAKKQASKAEKSNAQVNDDTGWAEARLGSPAPELFEPSAISPAQLIANRANAQLSTGPTTETGKAKTCLNAVKTALTGRTVLLPSDDAAEYERHIHAYANELAPVGQIESDLVQSIAEITWRLKRIPALEMAIFAKGHLQFADSFDEHDPSLRPGMIDLQTFITYEKQLRNLQLQEARLARRREKEMTELRKLQSERKSKQVQALDTVARRYLAARKNNAELDPVANGFEFSTDEIEHYLDGCSPAWIAGMTSGQGRGLEFTPPKRSAQAA